MSRGTRHLANLPKHWRGLVGAALDSGFTLIEISKKSRIKLRSPAGDLVTIPMTPTPNGRGYQNCRAKLRRYGADVSGV